MTTRKPKIQGAASWTMAIFGAMAFALGVVGLISPDSLLRMMDFQRVDPSARIEGDYTLTFMTGASMAAINMGAYYVLAARANWREFYRWTVPFRGLTFLVFTGAAVIGRAPLGFIGVAAWELLGAIATAGALRWDRNAAANAGAEDRPIPST